MTQTALPTSTISNSGFSIVGAATVHAALDEGTVTPDDATTLVLATAVGSSFEVGLAALNDPGVQGRGVIVSVRMRRHGNTPTFEPSATVRLKVAGVTVVTTVVQLTMGPTFATYTVRVPRKTLKHITNWSAWSVLVGVTTLDTANANQLRVTAVDVLTVDVGGYWAEHIDQDYLADLGGAVSYIQRAQIILPLDDSPRLPNGKRFIEVQYNCSGFVSSDLTPYVEPSNGPAWHALQLGGVFVNVGVSFSGVTDKDPAIDSSAVQIDGNGTMKIPGSGMWEILASPYKDGVNAMIWTKLQCITAGGLLYGVASADRVVPEGRSGGGAIAAFVAYSNDWSGTTGCLSGDSSRTGIAIILQWVGFHWLAFAQDGSISAAGFPVGNDQTQIATTLAQAGETNQKAVSLYKYAFEDPATRALNLGATIFVHAGSGSVSVADVNDDNDDAQYTDTLPENFITSQSDVHHSWFAAGTALMFFEGGSTFTVYGVGSRCALSVGNEGNGETHIVPVSLGLASTDALPLLVRDFLAWNMHGGAYTESADYVVQAIIAAAPTLAIRLPNVNEPPTSVGSPTVWAEVSFQWPEVEILALGAARTLRRTIDVEIDLVARVGIGPAGSETAADDLIDGMQGAEVGSLVFDSVDVSAAQIVNPDSVINSGSGNQVRSQVLSARAYIDESLAHPPEISGSDATSDLATLGAAIRSRVRNRVADTLDLAVGLDNGAYVLADGTVSALAPSNEVHLSVAVVPGGQRRVAIGDDAGLWRRTGGVFVQIDVPIGTGIANLTTAADVAFGAIAQTTLDGTRFGEPTLAIVGASGPWFVGTLFVPFTFDSTN